MGFRPLYIMLITAAVAQDFNLQLLLQSVIKQSPWLILMRANPRYDLWTRSLVALPTTAKQ